MAKSKKALTSAPTDKSEALTEHLLDVAASFFLKNGFAGSSVTQIAREARASKESFYSRFPTKEDLFRAVIQRQTDHMSGKMSALFISDAPIAVTLTSFGEGFLARFMADDTITLQRTLSLDRGKFPELGRMFYELGPARMIGALSRYLEQQVSQSKLRELNSEAAAHHFLGLIISETMLKVTLGVSPKPNKDAQQRIVKSAVDVFLHGYTK
ncbi:TetR/AcrR family transcriptional regulator [Tunturibacter empetritectus]|uniref:TetR/AcrR family transcriptional regulator n=1 Tax=Tunturiibacter empetritectus TaxID=3069691 RepID=A0AAU7ZHT3_9BACT